MPRRARVDPVAIASVGLHGVAAVADLTALGMPSSTIARRVQAGHARRVLRGVVKEGPDEPTDDQRAAAALLYAGERSVISGGEALRRHGLTDPSPRRRILVVVDAQRQRTSSAFVEIERTERLPAAQLVDGLAIAPLERAVIDTVRREDRLDVVRGVLTEVVQKGRTTVARLAAELAAGSQRGSALPRRVLRDELGAGVRSVAEAWARELHAESELPRVLWNPRLYDPSGTFIAQADGFFPDVGLAWEIDSVQHHFLLPDWDKTLRRRARMQAFGLVVAHTRPSRTRTERAAVVEELWGSYRLAASRPCPDLRIVAA
ncbi:hypothetical protein [Actinomycetospora straminea]|uniref:Transcriptional regulator, AbiEi antitoxin, Type IV TA system n=1 Tax=Actinomycetospora straminea TaxID=663607 RepID=A0ABP9E764_9PSEU|nr:hypothetical protein [Actinomycetospora straminea]MDD7932668.1 hypothetical protein [Actinomycetospora straminea]